MRPGPRLLRRSPRTAPARSPAPLRSRPRATPTPGSSRYRSTPPHSSRRPRSDETSYARGGFPSGKQHEQIAPVQEEGAVAPEPHRVEVGVDRVVGRMQGGARSARRVRGKRCTSSSSSWLTSWSTSSGFVTCSRSLSPTLGANGRKSAVASPRRHQSSPRSCPVERHGQHHAIVVAPRDAEGRAAELHLLAGEQGPLGHAALLPDLVRDDRGHRAVVVDRALRPELRPGSGRPPRVATGARAARHRACEQLGRRGPVEGYPVEGVLPARAARRSGVVTAPRLPSGPARSCRRGGTRGTAARAGSPSGPGPAASSARSAGVSPEGSRGSRTGTPTPRGSRRRRSTPPGTGCRAGSGAASASSARRARAPAGSSRRSRAACRSRIRVRDDRAADAIRSAREPLAASRALGPRERPERDRREQHPSRFA